MSRIEILNIILIPIFMVAFLVVIITIFPTSLKIIVPFGITPIFYIVIYMVHSVNVGRKEIATASGSLFVLLGMMAAISIFMWYFAWFYAHIMRNFENPLNFEVAYYGGIGYSITTIIAVLVSRREVSLLLKHRKRNSV